ncbi:MAG: hypothetical protein ACXW1S_07750 [Acidimicrobiia bacterium]
MTTFAPLAPTLHVPPTQVAADTRGLCDPTTGVHWAVDTFATPLPDPQMGVADLDPEFWDFGLMLFAMGERAFSRIRELPTLDPAEMPDQSVLDQIIAASAEPQS